MVHTRDLPNSSLSNRAASPWFLSFVYTSSGSTVAPIPGAKPQSGFKVTLSGDTPPSANNARTRCMIVSTLSMQPGSQLTQPARHNHANQPRIHSVLDTTSPGECEAPHTNLEAGYASRACCASDAPKPISKSSRKSFNATSSDAWSGVVHSIVRCCTPCKSLMW